MSSSSDSSTSSLPAPQLAVALTTDPLLHRAVHSRAQAAVMLASHAIQAHGWILARMPDESAWTAATLSYTVDFVRSCCRAAMRLRFVPLFDSIRVSGSLHLAAPSAILPPSLAALSDVLTQAKGIDIPAITIGAIWPKSTPDFGPKASMSLSSLPAEILAPAVSNLHAQLFESSADGSEAWWSKLESLIGRASAQSLDESLFCDFAAFVLHTPEPDTPAAALPPAAAVVVLRPRLAPFSSESTVSTRNACVTLVHLMLLYEGFRPVDEQDVAAGSQSAIGSASASTAAASSSSLPAFASMSPPPHPSESFVPSSWAAFSSHSGVYSLSFQHLSLQSALPRHIVRVKIVPMFEDAIALHMQLLPDCAPPPSQVAAEASAEEEDSSAKEGAAGSEMHDATEAEAEPAASPPPVVVSPKIYSLTLRASEFVSTSLAQSAASLDPHTAFVRVGALLSQLRNRILKHMLGASYRRATVSPSASTSSSAATLPKTSLDALPPELLLGVLSLLSSSDVLAVGHTGWSLHYLSLHSWIWKALCMREHPLPGDSAASAAAITDWKNAFRSRKQLKQEQQARDAERDRSLRQVLGSDPFGLFGPGGMDRLGQARWLPRGSGAPRPFPFHPFPGAVHPDAPWFTMPGRRS